MAMSVTYTTINGVIVHEALAGGGERELTADPLGSLVKIRTSAVNYSYSAEYWPYGEIQTQTGSNPTRWAFVGLLGYMRDLATMFYVRARYYRSAWTRWMTVDPLWPTQEGYQYVLGRPVQLSDPSGMAAIAVIAITGATLVLVVGGILLTLTICLAVALFGAIIYDLIKEYQQGQPGASPVLPTCSPGPIISQPWPGTIGPPWPGLIGPPRPWTAPFPIPWPITKCDPLTLDLTREIEECDLMCRARSKGKPDPRSKFLLCCKDYCTFGASRKRSGLGPPPWTCGRGGDPNIW